MMDTSYRWGNTHNQSNTDFYRLPTEQDTWCAYEYAKADDDDDDEHLGDDSEQDHFSCLRKDNVLQSGRGLWKIFEVIDS